MTIGGSNAMCAFSAKHLPPYVSRACYLGSGVLYYLLPLVLLLAFLLFLRSLSTFGGSLWSVALNACTTPPYVKLSHGLGLPFPR